MVNSLSGVELSDADLSGGDALLGRTVSLSGIHLWRRDVPGRIIHQATNASPQDEPGISTPDT
jgi:hypothetical protein